jgi:hypothetical protein
MQNLMGNDMDIFDGFESFQVGGWAPKGVVEKAPPHPAKAKVPESWKSNWKVTLGSLAISLMAVSPIVIGVSAAAFSLPGIDIDGKKEVVAASARTKPDASFASLFASFRAGAPLIPSESIRLLAERAAQDRNGPVDVDSWARRLAGDVKDATD